MLILVPWKPVAIFFLVMAAFIMFGYFRFHAGPESLCRRLEEREADYGWAIRHTCNFHA